MSCEDYVLTRLASVPPANRTTQFRAIVRREWKRTRPQGHYRGDPNWKRSGSSSKGTVALAKLLATKLKIPWAWAMNLVTSRKNITRAQRRRQAR